MKINHGILTYGDVSATCPTFLLDSAQHVEGFGVGGFFDAVKVAPGEEGRDLLWMVAFIAGLTDLAAAFVVIPIMQRTLKVSQLLVVQGGGVARVRLGKMGRKGRWRRWGRKGRRGKRGRRGRKRKRRKKRKRRTIHNARTAV
jgi:hypothetical protein